MSAANVTGGGSSSSGSMSEVPASAAEVGACRMPLAADVGRESFASLRRQAGGVGSAYDDVQSGMKPVILGGGDSSPSADRAGMCAVCAGILDRSSWDSNGLTGDALAHRAPPRRLAGARHSRQLKARVSLSITISVVLGSRKVLLESLLLLGAVEIRRDSDFRLAGKPTGRSSLRATLSTDHAILA